MESQIEIYQGNDGKTQIEVNFVQDTVWLSQEQLVELFQRDQSVISRHLRNVFNEGELDKKSNMQKMHIARSDKPVALYSLDGIISGGLSCQISTRHPIPNSQALFLTFTYLV